MSRYMILQDKVVDLKKLLRWEGLTEIEVEIVQQRIAGKSLRQMEVMNPRKGKPFSYAALHERFHKAIERRASSED